ncbi:hypothetical protein BH11BAC4_BH11BAC4_22650 [soil metagenome]
MKAFRQARNNSPLCSTRKKLGLSQQELADRLGVDRSTISLVELNLRSLPTAALLKLAALETSGELAAMERGPDMEEETETMNSAELNAWTRYCNQLLLQERNCNQNSHLLQRKLDNMTGLYNKTNEWLQAIDKAAEVRENAWSKRQRLVAMGRLSKCGLITQYLLQRRIDLLKAEAELNQNTYRQCQDDYVNLFLNQ